MNEAVEVQDLSKTFSKPFKLITMRLLKVFSPNFTLAIKDMLAYLVIMSNR